MPAIQSQVDVQAPPGLESVTPTAHPGAEGVRASAAQSPGSGASVGPLPPGMEQELRNQFSKEVTDAIREHVETTTAAAVASVLSRGQRAMQQLQREQAAQTEMLQGQLAACMESYKHMQREHVLLKASLEALMKHLTLVLGAPPGMGPGMGARMGPGGLPPQYFPHHYDPTPYRQAPAASSTFEPPAASSTFEPPPAAGAGDEPESPAGDDMVFESAPAAVTPDIPCSPRSAAGDQDELADGPPQKGAEAIAAQKSTPPGQQATSPATTAGAGASPSTDGRSTPPGSTPPKATPSPSTSAPRHLPSRPAGPAPPPAPTQLASLFAATGATPTPVLPAQAAAALAAAMAQRATFTLTLRRADNVPLGLEVEPEESCLTVVAVRPGGAVEAWNRQGGGDAREIRAGDRIVAINGTEDIDAMSRECLTKHLLRMTVARAPSTPYARAATTPSGAFRAEAREFVPQARSMRSP
mmetsp:Transcript_113066/g.315948  ORF Transcript_113066/g.315948 Transcript_113066/m.315948 type:complete len:470 (+) Transcript_113066:85-1494(+)